MKINKIFSGLLVIGGLFYAFEFALHFFGLPVLEHDKIFILTHDRYIALYGLSMAIMLWFVASDPLKHKKLFFATLIPIIAGMGNAIWIANHGGYQAFHVLELDGSLWSLGVLFLIWFISMLVSAYGFYRSH